MGSSNGMGCVCTVITLTFDNDQKISLSRVKREDEGKYQDCYYGEKRSGRICNDVAVGILFSQLAEKRDDIEEIKQLIQEYVNSSDIELLEDASAIVYGEMDICACVTKEYGALADPFNMLGIDAPEGFDLDMIVGVAEAQGVTKYYDDTLETLIDMRDTDSKGFLFFFSDDEDICVETSGENYCPPSLKIEDLGNLLEAEYSFELDLDTIDERKSNIVEWARENGSGLNLNEDLEPISFFSQLGLTCEIDDDSIKMEGVIDCTKLSYSFLDLIMVMQKGQDYWTDEVEGKFEKQESIYIEVKDGQLYLSHLD